MGLVARLAPFWVCDLCEAGWYAETYKGPRQCPKCGSQASTTSERRLPTKSATGLRSRSSWGMLNDMPNSSS